MRLADENYTHYEARQTTCNTSRLPTTLDLDQFGGITQQPSERLMAYLANSSNCDQANGYTGPLCATCLPKFGVHNNACWSCTDLIDDVKEALGYILILALVLTVVGVFCRYYVVL